MIISNKAFIVVYSDRCVCSRCGGKTTLALENCIFCDASFKGTVIDDSLNPEERKNKLVIVQARNLNLSLFGAEKPRLTLIQGGAR